MSLICTMIFKTIPIFLKSNFGQILVIFGKKNGPENDVFNNSPSCLDQFVSNLAYGFSIIKHKSIEHTIVNATHLMSILGKF